MNFIKKVWNADIIARLLDHPIVEKISGFRIMRPQRVGVVFEEVHLKRFLKHFQVDCVFDVGASEGQYASMLRRIGYKGAIVSFEPVPRALGKLHKKAKSDRNWYVEEVAIDSTARKTNFHVMAVDQYSSLNMPSNKETGGAFVNRNKIVQEIPVETATVKDMLAKYRVKLGFKRPFLKMDTQGSDLEIARGAGEAIGSFVGIQSELSIKRLYEGTSDYYAVINYYRSQGFELSAFVPNNAGFFPDLVEIDCIMYNRKFNA